MFTDIVDSTEMTTRLADAAALELVRVHGAASERVCLQRPLFQTIEIPEGARLTNLVADLVGDDLLMYASDYPHGESHFPESAGTVVAWDMAEERKRKLLWDNATRLYARAPLL